MWLPVLNHRPLRGNGCVNMLTHFCASGALIEVWICLSCENTVVKTETLSCTATINKEKIQQKSYLAWKFPALSVLLANSSLLHGVDGSPSTPGSGCPTHPEREHKFRLDHKPDCLTRMSWKSKVVENTKCTFAFRYKPIEWSSPWTMCESWYTFVTCQDLQKKSLRAMRYVVKLCCKVAL